MKMPVLALLTFVLAACGSEQSASTAKDTTVQSQEAVAVQVQELVFSRDMRPVDGVLTELAFKKSDQNLYTATLRRAASYMDGGESDTTDTLATALECVQTGADFFCSRDSRPSDGYLVELTMTKNSSGRYDVTQRTAYYDLLAGEDVDFSDTIASGLNLL